MQAIMMITALAWPMIGGVVVGLITGIMKKHGLVGTLIDMAVGGIAGYALTIGFMLLADKITIPEALSLPLSLGVPVAGALAGLWLKSCARSA